MDDDNPLAPAPPVVICPPYEPPPPGPLTVDRVDAIVPAAITGGAHQGQRR